MVLNELVCGFIFNNFHLNLTFKSDKGVLYQLDMWMNNYKKLLIPQDTTNKFICVTVSYHLIYVYEIMFINKCFIFVNKDVCMLIKNDNV